MKPIKLSSSIKDKALENFKKLLEDYKGDEGLNIKITAETLLEDFSNIEKPIVYVTASAYLKMRTLVHASTDELAWHGTVSKFNGNYLIENIYVYPQTVTSTTVDADDEKYAQWLMKLDDNVINRLRFQGHSHVTMAASPSGRDTDNWQKFLNLLKDDEFYIFCIANKHDKFYWNIYDMAANVVFEDKDIEMVIIDDQAVSIKTWVDENIKDNIVKETPTFRAGFPTGVYPNAGRHTANTPAVNRSYTIVDDTRPGVSNSMNKTTLDEYIPKKLLDEAGDVIEVSYAAEVDLYYSDGHIPGFWYSNTWGAFIMEGPECRARYGMPPKAIDSAKKKTTTGKRGRPPKNNKGAKV